MNGKTRGRLAVMAALLAAGALGRSVAGAEEIVSLGKEHVVCEGFMGFGAEWDSAAYNALGVTDEDFAVIAERVRWMRLPVVRTMMLTRWCYRGEDGFDWDNPDMRALYRQLDLCQQQGITVLLTDWGCESWTKVPGIENMVDPKYAEAIGTYMDYLVNERAYSCIKYFILVNEPNYEVGDFDRWKQGVLNVAAVFKRRGLDRHFGFAGSDHSNAPAWHEDAVRQLRDTLGAYDVHSYANDAQVRPGKLEAFFANQWQFARDNDPNAKRKPCIVGEAGMNDGARHPGANDNIDSFEYGLFMADYAVQAARAGSAAVCAWQLDDNGHEGFTWGMWKDKKNGLGLRPWFYVWSLLSRYFPRDATIYRPPESSPDWRIVIGAGPAGSDGKPEGWTFCLVNRGDAEVQTRVKVPDDAKRTLTRYVYSADARPTGDSGFPEPSEKTAVDLGGPLALRCPPRSVVLATTLPW